MSSCCIVCMVALPTVGKATMQTIQQLDNDNPNDFVKVTIDKFYRVTGKSSQYIGILPDVELPTFFNDMLPREKTMPTALKNDSINISLRYSKMPDEALKDAVVQSKERVDKSKSLNHIKEVNTKINGIYKNQKPPLPVTFDTVYDDVHVTDNLWKEISGEMDKESSVTVTPVTGAAEADNDSFLKTVTESKVKSVRTDPYIYESLRILQDMNNYKKR